MSSNNIPILPFIGFKWKWASYAPTESINDPVVLLGVLFRMRKLENRYKYSSDEFANEMRLLSNDLKDAGITIDLAGRTGERNLMRNSGQYWKVLGLIPPEKSSGIITLTPFGREVADRIISQTDFSARVIASFTLPNASMRDEDIQKWERANLHIYPLILILAIISRLSEYGREQAYITPYELTKIIIPLSGTPGQRIDVYTSSIMLNRQNKLPDLLLWPNCCPEANDFRMAREFLIFLSNYGYLKKHERGTRHDERYNLNFSIYNEIIKIINTPKEVFYDSNLIADTERKIVKSSQTRRPNQAKFRKDVLEAYNRCVITNVDMPEVLEAAHIMPYSYNGPDTASNGFPMRMDIHYLFDSGHLRISEDGDVIVSQKTRLSYGASIPPKIFIPEHVDKKHLRWRWDNYNGI